MIDLELSTEPKKDDRIAAKHLPWSPSLPESLRFTRKEVEKSEEEQKMIEKSWDVVKYPIRIPL